MKCNKGAILVIMKQVKQKREYTCLFDNNLFKVKYILLIYNNMLYMYVSI